MDALLPIILIAFMGFLLFNSSRQRKRQAQLIEQASVVGQEVMLGSGIYGTITKVDGDRVTLKSGTSTLVVAKGAIARAISASVPDPMSDESADSPSAAGSKKTRKKAD
jgi:preprotein translocase subunit YajC